MTARLDQLARERHELSSEIALHRVELALAAQKLRKPLRRVDEIRENVHFFRSHYAMLLLPLALLVLLNPRPALRALLGALSVWRALEGSSGPAPARALEMLTSLAQRRV